MSNSTGIQITCLAKISFDNCKNYSGLEKEFCVREYLRIRWNNYIGSNCQELESSCTSISDPTLRDECAYYLSFRTCMNINSSICDHITPNTVKWNRCREWGLQIEATINPYMETCLINGSYDEKCLHYVVFMYSQLPDMLKYHGNHSCSGIANLTVRKACETMTSEEFFGKLNFTHKNSFEGCRSFTNQAIRDSCYEYYYYQFDLIQCETIENTRLRDMCIYGSLHEETNGEICSNYKYRDLCLCRFHKVEMITNPDMRQTCIANFSASNINNCDTFNNEPAKPGNFFCIGKFTEQTNYLLNDMEQCTNLKNQDLKDYCYLHRAQTTFLSVPFDKNIGDTAKMRLECEKIINLESKERCENIYQMIDQLWETK